MLSIKVKDVRGRRVRVRGGLRGGQVGGRGQGRGRPEAGGERLIFQEK